MLGILAGLALVWRRLHLPWVATVVLVCSLGIALVDGVVPPWAAWVLIWVLASTGPDPRAGATRAGTAAAATVGILTIGALVQGEPGGLVILVGFTVVLVLVAVLVRTERGRLEALRRRAAVEERLRIARDLHDLVGHGLSVVSVQSGTARLALDADEPEVARRALAAIESSSRTALRELRDMLGLLRDLDPGPTAGSADLAAPALGRRVPGIAEIDRLVADVRAGGVDVTVAASEEWWSQPAGHQLCAYRVVQEGLTNAVKHAPGASVIVRLDLTSDGGVVSVRTNAVPPPPAPRVTDGSGLGLAGLSTRVSALGGEFHSGPTPDGWLVEARLPLERVGGH